MILQIALGERLVGGFRWNASSLVPRVRVLLDQWSGTKTRDPEDILIEVTKYRTSG